jgi:hypothetical protein
MRTILISSLILALATAPAVQAQQAVGAAAAVQPMPGLAPKSMPVIEVDTRAAVVRASEAEAAPAVVSREVSARTVLAVVGGLVLAVALIAFLR